MTAATPEDLLKQLLQQHPDAQVAAVDTVGIIVEMPASLGVQANVPSWAHAGVDLVGRRFRSASVNQFLHVGVGGVNRQLIEDRQDQVATCFIFELTAQHGVCVVLIAPGCHEVPDVESFVYVEPERKERYSRFIRDRDARVVEADAALSRILGFSLHEIQEQDIAMFIHPDDRNRAIASWYEAVFRETGGHVRWRARVRTKSNGWRWMEFTDTNYLRKSVNPHIATEMLDIDAEMVALEDLYSTTELLARLTDVLPVGVLHFDSNLNVTFLNDRLFQMLDIPADVENAFALDQFHTDDQAQVVEAMQQALAGSDANTLARFCAPHLSRERYVKLAFRPLRGRRNEVSGVVVTVTDTTAEVIRRRDLEMRASYDALTGSMNRESIYQAISDELNQVPAYSRGMAVLFADLDGFKAINDRLGHSAGDRLLRHVASKINTAIRSNDQVGRIGGDEFVVLCPDLAEPRHALEVASRIITTIREVPITALAEGSLGVSVGVVWTKRPGLDAETVVNAADFAMYTAKRAQKAEPVLVEL